MKQILLHMIYHNLTHLGELQRRLSTLHSATGVSDSYKKEKITEWATITVRLLGEIEPALVFALEHYPEFKDFINSCIDTLKKMREAEGIKTNICQCKGCKPEGCKPEGQDIPVRHAHDAPVRQAHDAQKHG